MGWAAVLMIVGNAGICGMGISLDVADVVTGRGGIADGRVNASGAKVGGEGIALILAAGSFGAASEGPKAAGIGVAIGPDRTNCGTGCGEDCVELAGSFCAVVVKRM